ncbi:hypothetical protein CYMTET_53901 [Cymbomonas tetramitiformis]|uniref:Uncharacterized protein n=1 Tax=Cymbomonas tetramitiformis TaxID=36881 RepID=A0AAE0ERA0_9CHLO|nr:hypothetical protein CYMTET_53901 [Cymbomonas tetramitiformis]
MPTSSTKQQEENKHLFTVIHGFSLYRTDNKEGPNATTEGAVLCIQYAWRRYLSNLEHVSSITPAEVGVDQAAQSSPTLRSILKKKLLEKAMTVMDKPSDTRENIKREDPNESARGAQVLPSHTHPKLTSMEKSSNYAPWAVCRRARIRHSPEFIEAALQLWKIVPKNMPDRLGQQEYLELADSFHVTIPLEVRVTEADLLEDWEGDRCGLDSMDFQQFCTPLFEFVDLWSPHTEPVHYANFLRRLMRQICPRDGTWHDRRRSRPSHYWVSPALFQRSGKRAYPLADVDNAKARAEKTMETGRASVQRKLSSFEDPAGEWELMCRLRDRREAASRFRQAGGKPEASGTAKENNGTLDINVKAVDRKPNEVCSYLQPKERTLQLLERSQQHSSASSSEQPSQSISQSSRRSRPSVSPCSTRIFQPSTSPRSTPQTLGTPSHCPSTPLPPAGSRSATFRRSNRGRDELAASLQSSINFSIKGASIISDGAENGPKPPPLIGAGSQSGSSPRVSPQRSWREDSAAQSSLVPLTRPVGACRWTPSPSQSSTPLVQSESTAMGRRSAEPYELWEEGSPSSHIALSSYPSNHHGYCKHSSSAVALCLHGMRQSKVFNPCLMYQPCCRGAGLSSLAFHVPTVVLMCCALLVTQVLTVLLISQEASGQLNSDSMTADHYDDALHSKVSRHVRDLPEEIIGHLKSGLRLLSPLRMECFWDQYQNQSVHFLQPSPLEVNQAASEPCASTWSFVSKNSSSKRMSKSEAFASSPLESTSEAMKQVSMSQCQSLSITIPDTTSQNVFALTNSETSTMRSTSSNARSSYSPLRRISPGRIGRRMQTSTSIDRGVTPRFTSLELKGEHVLA